MDLLFLFLCALIMVPMIFSVPLLYRPALGGERERGTVMMLGGLLVGILCWFLAGYVIIFNDWSLATWTFRPAAASTVDRFVQLDFFLYAVVMFSGSAVIGRSARLLLSLVPLWLLLVYVPVAWLLWAPNGWLNQAGARDFSGGLVVHLTAGLTSLVLAWGRPQFPVTGATENPSRMLALFLIVTGWLGFNLAPLGQFNHLVGLVITNTLLGVVAAWVGWALVTWRRGKMTLDDVINGVLCGLVTSTALVGYVSPLAMVVTALIGGVGAHWVTHWCQQSHRLFDPVDSFSINATGGLVGTLGLILFASPRINPAGGAGLFTGQGAFAGIELVALLVTAAITLVGTGLALRLATTLAPAVISELDGGKPEHA